MRQRHYDVFISFKHTIEDRTTPDYELALALYDLLNEAGIEVFFFPFSSLTRPQSDYSRAIDDALDQSTVLVVVGTRREYFDSEWVRYEWSSFISDIRSNRKPRGQVFTLVAGIDPTELPRQLRSHQSYDRIDIGRLAEAVGAACDERETSGEVPSTSGPARPDLLARTFETRSRFEAFRRSPTVEDCGDLSRAYHSRSRAAQALRMDELVSDASSIDMCGISLNFICQQFSADRVVGMAQEYAVFRLLFIDPGCEAMAQREIEEQYAPGRLAALTDLNISTIVGIRDRVRGEDRSNLQIRVTTETPRYNCTLLDDEFCVFQPYLPAARGVDSPTFALVRRSESGLLSTFSKAFEAAWSKGTPV